MQTVSLVASIPEEKCTEIDKMTTFVTHGAGVSTSTESDHLELLRSFLQAELRQASPARKQ